jgi:hypothetical protein
MKSPNTTLHIVLLALQALLMVLVFVSMILQGPNTLNIIMACLTALGLVCALVPLLKRDGRGE